MTSNRTYPLTWDENKAAEAAFRGLPPDPSWSMSAHLIYSGIQAQIERRSLSEEAALVSV
jgi:hypothetical protein